MIEIGVRRDIVCPAFVDIQQELQVFSLRALDVTKLDQSTHEHASFSSGHFCAFTIVFNLAWLRVTKSRAQKQ
jgi:hypothetical protein